MGADLAEHYAQEPREDTRLTRSMHGRLEYLRTQELLRRALPQPPAQVLDVGGGTGVHAQWLAADGYNVHVVDVVPDHVEAAATLPGVTAELGDARRLRTPDGSVDVVLLLGPLYHLIDAVDRAQALAEGCRVLRPGGVLAAACISRYVSVIQAGANGRLTPELVPSLEKVIRTGRYDGHLGFMPTYFHTAEEMREEMSATGMQDVAVYGIEGPAWPTLDAVGGENADRYVAAALRCARLVESDPLLVNTSAHLLAIAHR